MIHFVYLWGGCTKDIILWDQSDCEMSPPLRRWCYYGLGPVLWCSMECWTELRLNPFRMQSSLYWTHVVLRSSRSLSLLTLSLSAPQLKTLLKLKKLKLKKLKLNSQMRNFEFPLFMPVWYRIAKIHWVRWKPNIFTIFPENYTKLKK